MKSGILIFLYGAGVVGVFVVLLKLRLPSNTFLWRETHNTGHTPLFAILALCILGLLYKISSPHSRHGLYRYFLAFVITVALGTVFEIYQIWGGGDPDIKDVMRDIGGAFPALALAMVFDKGLEVFRNHRGRKYIISLVAVLVWFSAFLPLGIMASAYYERDKIFPTILDFESPLETKLVKMRNARLEIVSPPSGWRQAVGKAGKLTLLPGIYPGLEVREPYPDWSRHKFLKFDIFSSEPGPIRITIRVDDARHNSQYNDRFNRALTIVTGENEIAVPLEDIRKAPAGRQMNMKAIKNLMLFTGANKNEINLYIDNLRLE